MTRRILLIAGASYTDLVVCSHAMYLQKSGKYRCSALGIGGGEGHPGHAAFAIFEEVHSLPVVDAQPPTVGEKARLMLDLVSSLSSRWGWGDRIVPAASKKLSMKEKLYHCLLHKRYARELPELIRKYDICQWHCFAPSLLPALAYFPPESKVVLAIWGSDLLRTCGVEAYRLQLQACQRVTRIVVNSLEMREIFLAKFGRQFSEKIRLATIGCDLFNLIDQIRQDPRPFLARHGIPSEKIVVCIGHNASRSNQHIEILHIIGKLEKPLRDRIIAILPMTYGTIEPYISEVREAAKRARIDFRMLTDRLSNNEMAELRLCTDVMIHVPVSDAFSAAVAETIYGGGVLITGAWLPFGFLRRRGIHYHELEDLSEISTKLELVIDNLEEEKKKTRTSAPQMRNLKAWDHVIGGWNRIYDELCSE